jgi:hypothetical protein
VEKINGHDGKTRIVVTPSNINAAAQASIYRNVGNAPSRPPHTQPPGGTYPWHGEPGPELIITDNDDLPPGSAYAGLDQYGTVTTDGLEVDPAAPLPSHAVPYDC